MDLGFIGIGSMGGMLVRALLRGGAVEADRVWVANRSEDKLRQLASEWPGIHSSDAKTVARNAQVLFLCVHTADMLPLVDELRGHLRPEQTLIVIANLLPLRVLGERAPCMVAKVIPSITQEVGGGVSLVMFSERMTEPARDQVMGLLSRIGSVSVIPEELGRACADLSSAGPALLACVLQEMAAAAVACDPRLDARQAWELVVATASGTAALLREMPPEELIRRVATPGGMTAAGLEVLRATLPGMWRDIFERMKAREQDAKSHLGL